MDRDFYDNNEYFDDPLKDMEAAASGRTGGETSAAKGAKPAAKSAAKTASVSAEKPKKPEYKTGWAKPKPKKNARPVKKGGK